MEVSIQGILKNHSLSKPLLSVEFSDCKFSLTVGTEVVPVERFPVLLMFVGDNRDTAINKIKKSSLRWKLRNLDGWHLAAIPCLRICLGRKNQRPHRQRCRQRPQFDQKTHKQPSSNCETLSLIKKNGKINWSPVRSSKFIHCLLSAIYLLVVETPTRTFQDGPILPPIAFLMGTSLGLILQGGAHSSKNRYNCKRSQRKTSKRRQKRYKWNGW
jgi:hypothetical protein